MLVPDNVACTVEKAQWLDKEPLCCRPVDRAKPVRVLMSQLQI
jgi:hypothetical protein